MKTILSILFFLIFIPINAQELSIQKFDSIDNVINKTFDLNDQSEHGKAVVISNHLLESTEIYKDSLLLSKLYNSLSFSYAELKNKEKAFYYSLKGLEISKIKKDTIRLLLDYNDLGVTYQDFGLYEKADEAFLEAIKIAEAYDTDEAYIFPLYNYGNSLISIKKKYKEAEPYLLKSLAHTEKTSLDKDSRIYVDLYTSLGVVNYKLKRFKAAEDFFKKALEIAEEHKYFVSLLNFCNKKAMVYREDKRFEEAIEIMDKKIIILDSIETRKGIALEKKIEAEYKVKESKEKVKQVEKENEIQVLLFQKSQLYNTILLVLLLLLLVAVYWAFRNNIKQKKAKEKAEKLTKVKSEFYSEISHELRTPLYAVIELSSLLLKEDVSQSHKEYLESLNFSANHLIALVNNVLELNKVESGELKMNSLNTNLENLFSNIINSLEYALIQSNNTISLSYDKDIPEQLTGDSLKLSQVMINLISNAIKFTRNGHINVTVKKIGETKEGVKLYFEVSDNGAGISKENQKKIFDAYYQDAYQSDQTVKGTGLGLSIVHRLLEVMGTQINIESEINKGSKFFFELPFTYVKETKDISNNNKALAEQVKGLHLLIVDDNSINQLVTKKILETIGVTFESASSGTEAIETIKNKKFDCVLMDLHMPDMDGYMTSERIREFNADIPIIAFTAANSEDVEDRIKNSVMNTCVYKPFYTSDLIETICEVIAK